MRKIVVTGATSMIGVALIVEAIQNGTEVFAIVRRRTKRMDRLPHHPFLHVIECDLEQLTEVQGIAENCDVLYHFAWVGTNKQERDDPVVQEKNIRYTLEAVELAHKCGCKKFVGAGSQAEYGRVDSVIDEETRFKPEIAYGSAKNAAFLLSRKLCEKYGIIHVWGRIFSVYGRYDNEGTMLDYAIKCFQRGEVAAFSAGTQKWDYLNEMDAGRMFYLLGEYCNSSDSYPIAYGKSAPLKDYILCLADTMDSRTLCTFRESGASVKAQSLEVDTSKTISVIHYQPQISFEKGIKMMVEEYCAREERTGLH